MSREKTQEELDYEEGQRDGSQCNSLGEAFHHDLTVGLRSDSYLKGFEHGYQNQPEERGDNEEASSGSDDSDDPSPGYSGGYSGSYSTSSSSAYQSSSKSTGWGVFVGFAVLLVIAVGMWQSSERSVLTDSAPAPAPAPVPPPEPNIVRIPVDGSAGAVISQIGAMLGKETPPQIIDGGACPFEGCIYGETWIAVEDSQGYIAYPEFVKAAPESLRPSMTIRRGSRVTTETGVVLAKRHEGRVDLSMRKSAYAGGTNGPVLQNGQSIALYSYLGEGCYRSWVQGEAYVVCGVDTGDRTAAAQEWWVRILSRDGARAWVRASGGSFLSQEGLNSELGEALGNSILSGEDKTLKIERLLELGADLNGDAGRYGTTVLEGVMRSGDTELLKVLLARGLSLRKSCSAELASQTALHPDRAPFLAALLDGGMQLSCMTGPTLRVFLGTGIELEDYPVERAIAVAQVLMGNGASVADRDAEGRSIVEFLDDPRWAERVSPLKEAILEMAASRQGQGKLDNGLEPTFWSTIVADCCRPRGVLRSGGAGDR